MPDSSIERQLGMLLNRYTSRLRDGKPLGKKTLAKIRNDVMVFVRFHDYRLSCGCPIDDVRVKVDLEERALVISPIPHPPSGLAVLAAPRYKDCKQDSSVADDIPGS